VVSQIDNEEITVGDILALMNDGFTLKHNCYGEWLEWEHICYRLPPGEIAGLLGSGFIERIGQANGQDIFNVTDFGNVCIVRHDAENKLNYPLIDAATNSPGFVGYFARVVAWSGVGIMVISAILFAGIQLGNWLFKR